MESALSETGHHGHNIKRLRDLLGVKQETIAMGLHITQQAMSKLEQKEQVEDELLEKISKILNVPVESIKNFDDKAAINIVSNTFNEASFLGCQHVSFNPLDKVIELYERLLKTEQEKIVLLEKTIEALKNKV